MRIGAALFFLAVGAILKFAVAQQHTHGFNIATIGIILMVIGGIGLIAELIYQAISRRSTTTVRYANEGDERYVPRPNYR